MEIDSLPLNVFYTYVNCISIIEAQQDMRQIVNITFPDMKKETRKKVWKELSKAGNNFSRGQEDEQVSLKSIAQKMAAKLGFGG